MAAGEEAIRLLQLVRIRHCVDFSIADTGGRQASVHHAHHVVVAFGGCQVFRHTPVFSFAGNVAVVQMPVVVGHDLEQVRDATELRCRSGKLVSGKSG
ncbi:Uncharacterised protein [Chlamydia trachomatis]|nr:Uncharacterised protein [Chlamydia trachomatis]